MSELSDRGQLDSTPLIPRELLFGNPERWQPMLSPDGKRMAWLAPDPRGVRQIWINTRGHSDDRCVTADHHRGISFYGWTWDSKTIIYLQDSDGDENYHLFAVDLDTGNVRDLTPWQGVRCDSVLSNCRFPDQLVVAINLRDRKKMDAWRIDLKSGAAVFDSENPGDVTNWLADDDLVVRGASAITATGANEIRVRDSRDSGWRVIANPGVDDEAWALGFSKDGNEIFIKSNVGRDTLSVIGKDLSTGREREISSRLNLDAEHVEIHPTRRTIEAVRYSPGRNQWMVTDSRIAKDFDELSKIENGDFSIINRDAADETWVVFYDGDTLPGRYYLWDRNSHRATLLFDGRPALTNYSFGTTKPITYKARDGLDLHGYLTIPPGVDSRRLPMILFVHGGPWARDYWGFNTWVQFLANRGYAVLQPNYRGSTGYGKKYLHAADLQWGRAMQDDLTDAVQWAIGEGVADPPRVAIFGASYGGYAALAGAAFTPDLYRCAVDIVGPSSLFTLMSSFPPYWGPIISVFKRRMGDPKNPDHVAMLKSVSPLFAADRIQIPMLIAQGANDPRVTQIESEQIVAAIERNHGKCTYVLYPDEGHGFARPANNIDFMSRAEKFLAEHMGGRYESLETGKFADSSAILKTVG
jgi:dipeptidyl aminopeptidase/acylaminoacyl peptidase